LEFLVLDVVVVVVDVVVVDRTRPGADDIDDVEIGEADCEPDMDEGAGGNRS
jgi:hypothetical protein